MNFLAAWSRFSGRENIVPQISGPTSNLRELMSAWRHDFHQHPELGFNEHRTSSRVADLLEGFGLEVHTGIGQTGVVGVLQKGNATTSIGLRADMDALPIQETSSPAYKSCNDGVMHACGHDGHTSMLLGAAKHLADNGDFNGRVVFIFQPNEEYGLGACAMLDDGLFDKFGVDEVHGMHNIPGMETGTFATRAGPITASESLFEIEISAHGGHAALPHMGVDAILVGSEIVSALQTIVSRKLNPSLNGVVSVTEFETDGRRNVLPGKATLRGDARALSTDINRSIESHLRNIVEGVCVAHGVKAVVSYDPIFPVTCNAADAARSAVMAARKLAGKDAVDGDCHAQLFSEDFAHLAAARPGCFMLMGNGVEGAHGEPLHSSSYDFNDEALVAGSSYWVSLVEQHLGQGE